MPIRRALSITVLGLSLFLVACGSDLEIQVGVPAARDFDDPVPVRIADVEIGRTGRTGLGPDNRPVVMVRIRRAHRDRITDDTHFFVRRENILAGPRYLEAVPGVGQPVADGHHFTASAATLGEQAQQWWDDLLRRTQDPQLQARLDQLREDFDEAIATSRERWEEERPQLEARARELLEELDRQSSAAAREFERWLEDTRRRAQKRPVE